MPNPRRKSRIAALQALYEADVSGHDAKSTLDRLCADGELSDAQTVFAHANLVRSEPPANSAQKTSPP